MSGSAMSWRNGAGYKGMSAESIEERCYWELLG
jgi:hypothetical protein